VCVGFDGRMGTFQMILTCFVGRVQRVVCYCSTAYRLKPVVALCTVLPAVTLQNSAFCPRSVPCVVRFITTIRTNEVPKLFRFCDGRSVSSVL
jgi:hypothetical protein